MLNKGRYRTAYQQYVLQKGLCGLLCHVEAIEDVDQGFVQGDIFESGEAVKGDQWENQRLQVRLEKGHFG